MKLRRVALQNVRSFLDRQEFRLDGDISILIGPNGGGKTNLLDSAVISLRLYLLKSWVPRHNPTAEWQDRYEWTNNDALNRNLLEKHSAGTALDQIIELDIEVTDRDIENIESLKAESAALFEKSKSKYSNTPADISESRDTSDLKPGMVFTYTIRNGSVVPSDSKNQEGFRKYLEYYEVTRRLREEYESKSLSTPMIFMPVTRSSSGLSSSVALADFNEYDHKRTVDAASSRSAGSIASLAVGRLAERYRYLLERDNGKATDEFKGDPAIKGFTDTLLDLGYSWNLKCTNVRRNQYDIELTKQGSTFRVGAASSGERELLTYLFAIYALNVRDALIVIDEPELHLHPRWQRTLLSLFERLSAETKNQFVMATHSPVFVSPSSIQYVSRVYSQDQRSRVVRLSDIGLPEPKHLFSIVNSQNNERIFFSDLVILVEGISDKIFFEAFFRHHRLWEGSGKVYEVVSVGGKGLFQHYEKLLRVSQTRYFVIADQDYAKDVGDHDIRSLFCVSASNIKNKVIDDPTSIDATSLVKRIEAAIDGRAVEELKTLWEYIKLRQSRLRTDLSSEKKQILDAFLKKKRDDDSVFILSRGALEAYLPEGYRGKDVEKLIRLTSSNAFVASLPSDGIEELELIVRSIGQP